MSEERCLTCNEPIRHINYALGPEWVHVDPNASFPTAAKGTAWRYCRRTVAQPRPPRLLKADQIVEFVGQTSLEDQS